MASEITAGPRWRQANRCRTQSQPRFPLRSVHHSDAFHHATPRHRDTALRRAARSVL